METGIDLSKENYKKLSAPRLSKELSEVKTQLSNAKQRQTQLLK